jgi:hypothetical protein
VGVRTGAVVVAAAVVVASGCGVTADVAVPVAAGPAATTTPPTAVPATAPPATFPPGPTTTWQAGAGGLQVTVTAPAQVVAGEPVTFEVHAADDLGSLVGAEFRFGDGHVVGFPPWEVVCAYVDDGPADRPLDHAEEHVRAFRQAGSYEFTAGIWTGGCDTEMEHVAVDGRVVVLPGDTEANGPLPPVAQLGHEYFVDGDPSVLVTDVGGRDDDGWVTTLELDWGDGSDPVVLERGTAACTDPGDAWVASSWSSQQRHRYPAVGAYEVHLRVVSSGCDGTATQVDEATGRFNYPPVQGS